MHSVERQSALSSTGLYNPDKYVKIDYFVKDFICKTNIRPNDFLTNHKYIIIIIYLETYTQRKIAL